MTKQKRVVHLLYSGLGGHGSVFFSLVKADRKNEIHTEAIFCGIEDMREDYIQQCKTLNISYTFIKKKRGLDPGSYLGIYKTFSKIKPEVILLHGTSFIIPAKIYKIFHPKTRLIVRETQAHHLKTKNDWMWLRLAVRFSDQIIFLTNESAEGVSGENYKRMLQKKAVIIPNGVDTEMYNFIPGKDISKKIVIGMQSRLQKIKDHKTLLKAFALLKQKFLDRGLCLRIAGDGETKADLEKTAADLQIRDEVEFCGMLNEKELIDFMHSLDIYVHATLGETMSNSIMQAMACGLPIIASNVWGVNNMISNNVDGLLFNSGDEKDLCHLLSEVISDPVLRKEIAARAREAAFQKYSQYRLFEDYKGLYYA